MSIEITIEALETAIEIHEAASNKLLRAIRRKRRAGEDLSKEQREQARVARKLNQLENLLAEYEAGRVVVSAPTRAEIDETRNWLTALRELTVQDAAVAAGFTLITDALRDARDLATKVT